MQSESRTRFIPIGLMLFALFFGAGNLIFPASMGQAAGTDVWWALLGFCITGVGLPLLTVVRRFLFHSLHSGHRSLLCCSSYRYGLLGNCNCSFP